MTSHRFGVIIAASVALAACGDPTRILVVVDSDLVPGTELSELTIKVGATESSDAESGHVRELKVVDEPSGANQVSIPFSFAVVVNEFRQKPLAGAGFSQKQDIRHFQTGQFKSGFQNFTHLIAFGNDLLPFQLQHTQFGQLIFVAIFFFAGLL